MLRIQIAAGRVQCRIARDGLESLWKITDPQAWALADATAIQLLLAENQSEECRLANAVGADQSDAASRAQVGRGLFEQRLGRELLADGFELKHLSLVS